ncbi:ATP-binding cassette domain-containing protein [bacterium]|nr:ATP-binding cassette domain-containing protein [bacterium]
MSSRLLQGDSIAFRFPDQTEFLFQDANFSVQLNGGTPSRIGLVGPNGEGKTTLLRILTGELQASQGRLLTPSEGLSLAVQPQRLLEESETLSLEQFLLEPLQEVTSLRDELSMLEDHLATDTSLLTRYGEVQSRFEALGGYDLEARLDRVRSGLGIMEIPLERTMATLSSGQKTRAALARMLLTQADLLLFDEPTNHLDREAIEWLERVLADSNRAFVVVSHDRAFLDRATNETWAVRGGTFESYPGNYSAYDAFREERNARITHERSVQKKEVKRLESSLRERAGWSMQRESQKAGHGEKRTEPKDRGFIGARSAAQMKRALAIRTRIEHELEKKKIEMPQVEEERILTFPTVGDAPGLMARLDDVVAGYGEGKVLDRFNLEIRAGERIILTGPNGSGKSTVLRLLAGLLREEEGRVHLHPRTSLHLYSQEQAELLGRDAGWERVGQMGGPDSPLSGSHSRHVTQSPPSEMSFPAPMSGDSLARAKRQGASGIPRGDASGPVSLHAAAKEAASDRGRDPGNGVPGPPPPAGSDSLSLLEVIADRTQHNRARLFLGYLGIRGDEVFRPVGSLSPGELARAALVRTLLSDANLILLDEPTNHLDIQAREALERGLLAYEGALVVVTHDLRLRERLGGRVVEM